MEGRMTVQMRPSEQLNRGHIGIGIAVGILGVVCATATLSPGQKSGGSLLASLFASAVSAGAFAVTIQASQVVEKSERITERFRQQDEDVVFAQRGAIAQAQVQRLQLKEGAKLQVDEMIAEDDAREYYAEHLGVPVDALYTEIDEEEESQPKVTLQQQTQAVAHEPPSATQPSQIVAPPPDPPPSAPNQPATPVEAQATVNCQLLDEIVVTDISTVFASATGTGKSVSESYILNRLFSRFPHLNAWAIAQKNDSFCGLREKGRTALFDPVEPLESLAAIDEVYSIFNKRRQMMESERFAFKHQPVRLILSDWHSIWDTCKDEKWYKTNYAKKLSTLVTVGREMNVCLLVDTQSYNVASLGITEDANIRSNLNILCQGYSWIDSEGRQRGDWNMITNLLKNRYLVPTGSDQLLTELESLKPKSIETKTPVIFSSIGLKLQLLPDLRAFKHVN
jgi:hypothetical protein